MKNLLSFAMLIIMTFCLNAQTSKVINLVVAGTLTTNLTDTEKNNLLSLTITGKINAKDFKCLRDEITKLQTLDISNATIEEYSGSNGPSSETTYSANTIPSYAFYNNSTQKAKSTLRNIYFSNSLKEFGPYAFYYCSGLLNFSIPASVETIGIGSFGFCTSLTSITIPNSVTSLGARAFSGCYYLQTVKVGDFVPKIDEWAFSHCYRLTNLTLGASITSIGYNSFYSCIELNSISLPSSLLYIDEQAFYLSGLTQLIIPNSVLTIGNESFLMCPNLTTVELGNSLLSIGDKAFSDCRTLSSVKSYSTLPPTLGSDVFFSYISNSSNASFERKLLLQQVLVAPNAASDYKNASTWTEYSDIILGTLTTSTKEITSPSFTITVSNNEITINRLNVGDRIIVYNSTGCAIITKKAINNNETIQLKNPGLFIISINGICHKTLVK
jgi:hypothetical protein